jgi:hypothetical protein
MKLVNSIPAQPVRLQENSIKNLKSKARKESSKTGEKRHVILDRYALSHGHSNWSKLQSFHKSKSDEVIQAAPKQSNETKTIVADLVSNQKQTTPVLPAQKTTGPKKAKKLPISHLSAKLMITVSQAKTILMQKKWMLPDYTPSEKALLLDIAEIRHGDNGEKWNVWHIEKFTKIVEKIPVSERRGYFTSRHSFTRKMENTVADLGFLVGIEHNGVREYNHPRTKVLSDKTCWQITEFMFNDPHCIGGPGVFFFVKSKQEVDQIFDEINVIIQPLMAIMPKSKLKEAQRHLDVLTLGRNWLKRQV